MTGARPGVIGRALGGISLAAGAACAPHPFELTRHDLGPDAARAGVRLDQPLVFTFSAAVDPGSVRPETVRLLRERDGAPVAGTFQVEDERVVFTPHRPCRADLADAGLTPGERYRIEIVGLPVLRCVRDGNGEGLAQGATGSFSAVAAAADAPPALLFADPQPGPPHLTTRTTACVAGRARLEFDQPLDPRAVARARFWLLGPWSRAAHPEENPILPARLVDNQERAVIELDLDGSFPAPLAAQESYKILLEPAALTDVGGQPLPMDQSVDDVPLEVGTKENP